MNLINEFIDFLIEIFFGKKTQKSEEKYPYQKKKYLLTINERNFYEVLSEVAQEHNKLLFTKVRLEDLLLTPGSYRERQIYRNKVKSKHIDFVLCDKETVSPILAIELDDSTHNEEKAQERDEFKNRALANAGLPILRIKVKSFYNPQELSYQIAELLK